MKVLFAIIGLLASCHAKNLVDYRVALSKTCEKPKNCTTSGLFCESCSSLVACIQDDDTYTKQNVKTCDYGEKCIKNKCTTAQDPFCDGIADLPFPCQAVGIFPDPFYCNKFVLCVQTKDTFKAYPNQCEQGLGYNIGTGLCDIVLPNGVCPDDEYPIPLCTELGHSEALEGKPQEYFICKEYGRSNDVMYPFIDVCSEAKTYDNYICS
ncbi:uncharacterized protein LOC135132706 [Zophobas morio]|uniref:uncharacterized protein LOC135132706 n=1 Tax=Zophobas morio TaxID=2755281 RepID=UPI0030829E18